MRYHRSVNFVSNIQLIIIIREIVAVFLRRPRRQQRMCIELRAPNDDKNRSNLTALVIVPRMPHLFLYAPGKLQVNRTNARPRNSIRNFANARKNITLDETLQMYKTSSRYTFLKKKKSNKKFYSTTTSIFKLLIDQGNFMTSDIPFLPIAIRDKFFQKNQLYF